MPTSLGDLQQLVMLALVRLGEGRAFGGAVQQELEAVAGRRVSVSTVYVTLVRLEDQGLVCSSTESGERGQVGRPRRHFTLTPAGWEALQASRKSLNRMWDGVEST